MIQDSPQAVTFDFAKEKTRLDAIISDWGTKEKDAIEVRRKVRANKRNVEEERMKKTILNDETIIPDKTIANNIRRNRTIYINYVTKTKNSLVVTDLDNPARDMENLQLWFTRGMHFPNWSVPWIQLQDGMQLHGGVAMEVVYNTSKPFNVDIEYIPRDCLIFPRKTKDLQACGRLLRKYEITTLQLEEFQVKYGFDEAITKRILDRHDKEDKYINIYRPLLKKDGTVYNAWYSQDENGWLRPPQEHQIGLFDYNPEEVHALIQQLGFQVWLTSPMRQMLAKPLLLKNYPITWFPLDLEESQMVLEVQGRAALDIHEQEALTSLLSSTVNGAYRASNLYPSAEAEPGDDAKLMELGEFKPGVVLNRKITINQLPWPNQVILAIIQALDIRKAQSSGNADYAALARKDANKTATEMKLAGEESEEQSSIDLTIYANPYLDVYSLCFLVAQQQAIFGLCKPPDNIEDLFGNYSFQAAGDIEILRKNEQQQNAQKFFELVKGTPLGQEVLTFLIDKIFPDYAKEWNALLQQKDQTQLIAVMLQALSAVPTEGLTDEQRSQLQSIINAAQSVVAQSGNGNVIPISGGQTGPATPQSNEAPQGQG